MSVAIIDAREWQNLFDLRTGEKTAEDGRLVRMVRGVLARHPYPGDVDRESNRWVTDTALDLMDKYQPRFVFLSYAQQYFVSRFTPLTETDRKAMLEEVMSETDRFIRESGLTSFLMGTGDMTPFRGYIDISRLDGLGISSNWSARYAGLHDPTQRDLDFLTTHPRIERVVERDEWIDLFGYKGPEVERIPQYLLVAEEGWAFKSPGIPLRKASWLSSRSFSVPYATDLGKVRQLTEIPDLILTHLEKQPIALIVLEGMGLRDFDRPHDLCANGLEWFYYEPGEGQYLTLTTGEHRIFDYPPGYRSFDVDGDKKEFPFSGYFKSVPSNTLGERFAGKNIAVGNRSMLMHMIPGADISVECFARNLYNHGTMGVVHRAEKF
ncbi:MAG: hypothetical protein ACOWYE_07650 [Desulfatiglandales bacterium]